MQSILKDGYSIMSEIDEKKWKVESVSLSEWQKILSWAKAESWDIGEGDDAHFFNVDEQGFFVGFLNGEPIASLSVVNHTDDYAHVGHYIVLPAFRGKPWGKKLFIEALKHAGNRSLGGDGMSSLAPYYGRWGFKPYFRTLRYSGILTQQGICSATMEKISSVNINEVINFDRDCTGLFRSNLLNNWFQGDKRFGFITRSADGISGLVGIRRSSAGYRIGPLYANSSSELNKLFSVAAAEVPKGEQLTLDVPEEGQEAFIELIKSCGLRLIFDTYRFYRGMVPQPQSEKIRALTSLELG